MINPNHKAVRRLMHELSEMESDPDPDFDARPVSENDLFLWHFIIRGPSETPFEGGIYHGKIVFPIEYPLMPPDVYFLTPNGRFETNKKICLSATSYHKETWQAAWDARHLLRALIAFLPTNEKGIGYIDSSDEVKRDLALKSRTWSCTECKLCLDRAKDENNENSDINNNKVDNDDASHDCKENVEAVNTQVDCEKKTENRADDTDIYMLYFIICLMTTYILVLLANNVYGFLGI